MIEHVTSVLDEVAAGVLVSISRRELTTSTVVVTGRQAVLVDPAWEPDELDGLADALDDRGLTVTAGVATHAHHDHVLWHPRFGSVPRYASERTVALAREHRTDLVRALGPAWPSGLAELVGRLTPLPGSGAVPSAGAVPGAEPVPGVEPVEFVVHDGHAAGHTALWLPQPRVLIAGDMLSDVELPLLSGPVDASDPVELSAYLAALDVLAPYVARAQVLVPGHGHPTTSPADRLADDRRYLEALLAGDDPDDPRRANPGMSEVHAQLRQITRR